MPSYGHFEHTRRLAIAAGLTVPPCYIIGLDLGQSRDPSAIAIVRRLEIGTGELAMSSETMIAGPPRSPLQPGVP
jgi:hypothetical protein